MFSPFTPIVSFAGVPVTATLSPAPVPPSTCTAVAAPASKLTVTLSSPSPVLRFMVAGNPATTGATVITSLPPPALTVTVSMFAYAV